MTETHTLKTIIPEDMAGARLDQALARLFPQHSRSRLQAWIKAGRVRLNEAVHLKPREAVLGGEAVSIDATPEPVHEVKAEAIGLDIVFEDAHVIVLNKPPGLVTHPGAGNWRGTLQNALMHHAPMLEAVPRSGIVHRLDKDTSGLMVVAKTLTAHTALINQLQARTVRREYLALVQGPIVAGGTVDAPIGRHPVDRKRMAVVGNGKPALTHYRVEERLNPYTLLRVSLETGRTHQIRVHMAHIRHPIVGDGVYGGRLKLPAGASEALIEALRGFRRQALHATRLGLEHPGSGEMMSWEVGPPEDMLGLLEVVRGHTGSK